MATEIQSVVLVHIHQSGFAIRAKSSSGSNSENREKNTFEKNAVIKAVEASRLFPGLVLSDDSGLEVDALAGAPGVRSARAVRAGQNQIAIELDPGEFLLEFPAPT